MERGNISIHTENIFPIIKKWLYSEKDIFIRELVSNGSDAVSKLKKLAAIPSRDTLLTMFAAGLMEHVKNLAICLDLHAKNLEK